MPVQEVDMRFERKGKCRCEEWDTRHGVVCNSCATLAFRVWKFIVDLPGGCMVRVVSLDDDVGKEVETLRQLEFQLDP